MKKKLNYIVTFIFIFFISSCGGNKKENFDFSDFKVPVKENINNETTPSDNTNSNNVQYELKPLKNREEVLSSFKFKKKDPFKLDSQTSNKLSDIKLKGFLTISNKNYAVVSYLENEGSINTESIGGENTNLLPKGAFVKEINPSNGYVSFTFLDELFIINFEG